MQMNATVMTVNLITSIRPLNLHRSSAAAAVAGNFIAECVYARDFPPQFNPEELVPFRGQAGRRVCYIY